MTTYREQALELERQAGVLTEKAILLGRLAEIEEAEQNGQKPTVPKPVAKKAPPANKPDPTTAKKQEEVVASGGEPVKRGRGRPKGSKNKKPPMNEDGSRKDLPAVLEIIGQQAKGPLNIADFVRLVRESGYKTKSKNISNIVHQALVKLAKNGVFTKSDETREYTYVGKAA